MKASVMIALIIGYVVIALLRTRHTLNGMRKRNEWICKYDATLMFLDYVTPGLTALLITDTIIYAVNGVPRQVLSRVCVMFITFIMGTVIAYIERDHARTPDFLRNNIDLWTTMCTGACVVFAIMKVIGGQ